jgi:L-lactate dehydrogenase (cytochrome)
MIGRAYLYGLGAGGQAGVTRAIEILRNELDVTMALTGTRSVKEIGAQVLSAHVLSAQVLSAHVLSQA